MAEVETNGSHEASASLLIPCIKSLKRTYELFTANQINLKFSEDMDSQRIKVYSKVQDEYASVRDLPPPAPPSRAVAVVPTNSTSVATTGQTETALSIPSDVHPHGEIIEEREKEGIQVIGGHAYPSGPGNLHVLIQATQIFFQRCNLSI